MYLASCNEYLAKTPLFWVIDQRIEDEGVFEIMFLSILVIYYIIEYIAFDLNGSTLWLYVLYLINMSEYILISQL